MRSWLSLAALAWRESRNTRRRLLLYMSAISLGVAALVAIDSYASNIKASVREQSRTLLGGDLAFSSRQPLPAQLDPILDTLQLNDVDVARVTTFASMALAPSTGRTRLVQVRAVSELFPLYGSVITDPPGAWASFHSGDGVVVDPTILTSLQLSVGDSLRVGLRPFVVSGTLRAVPGDPGVIAAIGPRVLLPIRHLDATGLLAFGSVAQREVLLRLPPELPAEVVQRRIRRQLDSAAIRGRTAEQSEESLTESIDQLTDFLALVGLVALLLGGIGVGSGVHAHITRKVDTVAILRSIGATSKQVLTVYVAQAAVMGVIGAMLGAVIGVLVQFAIPLVASEFLPVDVKVTIVWSAVLAGVLAGGWIALAFALFPLLGIRKISPLNVLRRDVQSQRALSALRDPFRILVALLLVASLTAVAISRTDAVMRGVVMAAAVAVVVLLLVAVAAALTKGARLILRAGWPFVMRQGIANLYRPANQTRAVILALGFGAFLMSMLYLVQVNLLQQFAGIAETSRGNLLLFDIQEDQATSVDSILATSGADRLELTPIVTMRIASINGVSTAQLVNDRRRSAPAWPLRREYRSTYADSLDASEMIVAGAQFGGASLPTGFAEVSFEQEVASDLRVALGDTVVWDVQGVNVPTIVTSLREVNWGRMETNFFAIFGPGSIQSAPKQFALLARVGDDALSDVQGRIVARHANVSSIDLSLVAQTIAGIQDKAAAAVRFTAIFSLMMGIPVLMSAVAATRRERVREGVLLRALGASRRQIQRIMLAEYATLGALGTLTGVLLGIAGAWGAMWFLFEQRTLVIAPEIAIVGGLMIVLTVTIGYLSGRDVFRATPAEALRD